MKHLFIVNPVAGGNRNRFEATKQLLGDFAGGLTDPYEIYITKKPLDACYKIAEESKSEEALNVYACGGDGTLNECANGAAGRKNVAITHYPCGTGNDFIKMFGKDSVSKFSDLDALTHGVVRPMDIIECNGRYGINICSVGIDARIGVDVHKYSSIPIIGGSTGYVASLVVNVIKGVTQYFKITAGDTAVQGDFSLICACNGQFYGGGFNPVPDAVPDDGILDFLIVDGVSRFKLVQVVGKYAKGRYRELGDIVTHIRGGYMEIESDREFVVNIDGESIYDRRVTFRVVPAGVNFIYPSKMELSDDLKGHDSIIMHS